MPRSVAALGSVVAMTVSWLFPLPDYVKHEETGVGKLRSWEFMISAQVLSVPDLEFNNYGETVRNTPSQTFFPKTVAEIQELVRFARSRGRRLRAAGMKHSWSDIFRWAPAPTTSHLPP